MWSIAIAEPGWPVLESSAATLKPGAARRKTSERLRLNRRILLFSLRSLFSRRQGKPHRADVNQRTGFWLRIKSNVNCNPDLIQMTVELDGTGCASSDAQLVRAAV